VTGKGPGKRNPLGERATLAELEGDPHPLLARLRADEPVSWLPALGGWLVTRFDLAARVIRDGQAFTVDDPRFTTARVVGPSMLSLDGAEHDRHREPFSGAFGAEEIRARLAPFVRAAASRLVTGIERDGSAELRRSVAGPLAVEVVAAALGLGDAEPGTVLAWYDAIVSAVSGLAAGNPVSAAGTDAFGQLSRRLRAVIDGRAAASPTAPPGSSQAAPQLPALLPSAGAAGGLTSDEVVSNAAVMMFGGIETTEGMITNAVLHLLSNPGQLALVRADRRLLANAIEESLRLEPAAALVDRYAARDVELAGARIRSGDLVSVSVAGAGRDPAVFPEPDRYNVTRENAGRHLGFARGPHFCLGVHLARLETETVIAELLARLPGLRLDPDRPSSPRGLVFRKPPTLHVLWNPPGQ
jgi:cytochrome P450